MKNNEISVSEATREILKKKPFLKELMDMDAVNYRGLARNFKEEVKEATGKEKINLDSIVMAIRRYEQDADYSEGLMERIERVLNKSELFMIGDVVYYTLPREKKYHELAMNVYEEVDKKSGERVYLLQSDSEIGLVVSKKNSKLIEEKINESEVKNLNKDLAIVGMDSPEEILEANGILSYLTQKIIMNGIGVVEMFSTYTETIFLVEAQDDTNTYSTLKELIQN